MREGDEKLQGSGRRNGVFHPAPLFDSGVESARFPLGELHREPAHLQQVQTGQDAHSADREEGQDESAFHQGAELDVSTGKRADVNSEFRTFLKNNMPQITSNTSIYIRFSFLVVILIAILFVVLKAFNPSTRTPSYDVEENALLVSRPAPEDNKEDEDHHCSVF